MKKYLLTAIWLAAGTVQAAEVPAQLHWSQRVELSPPVSGVVRSVNVSVGEHVKKGQIMLRLDDQGYASRAEEASAAVARRKEEAAEAGRELKRVQELYDRTVISTVELDQAKLKQANAAAQLQESQARHRLETKRLADASVRAPFDALVVARMAEPGQTVAAGLQPQPLLVVAKAGEMVARALVGEVQMSKLKIGQEVGVSAAKQDYSGKIKTLALEPQPREKGGAVLYAVDVVFAPGEAQLRAGMTAVMNLP